MMPASLLQTKPATLAAYWQVKSRAARKSASEYWVLRFTVLAAESPSIRAANGLFRRNSPFSSAKRRAPLLCIRCDGR